MGLNPLKDVALPDVDIKSGHGPSPSFQNDSSRSTSDVPLHQKEEAVTPESNETGPDIEPRKIAVNDSRWTALYLCLPHIIPLAVTVVVVYLNASQFYFQISVPRIKVKLYKHSSMQPKYMTYFTDPVFWGAMTAATRPRGLSRALPLGGLVIFGILSTTLMGPSSAILMIPTLGWWNVGSPFDGRQQHFFLNHSAADLWPAEITTALYPQGLDCSDPRNSGDCPISFLP